jgi:predicted HAD superfamily Cof-like phosphohydrolase
VQTANMAKLGEDGKPIYGEDGKVKKPDGWLAPEPLLDKEIKRQMERKDFDYGKN